MLGFGAIGTLAVATGPNSGQAVNFVLLVDAASYTVSTVAASFKGVENISPAAFVVAAQGVTESEIERVTATSFAVSTSAVKFAFGEPVAQASIAVTPSAVREPENEFVATAALSIAPAAVHAAFVWPIASASVSVTPSPVNELEVEPVAPASFSIAATDVILKWNGAPFDLVYGGVGHYLLEAERAKQLAAITRKVPPAIDLRSQPRFDPIRAAPVAPPAPAVDLAAIAQQRMAGQMAAMQAAKKRRNEQALLLLAS